MNRRILHGPREIAGQVALSAHALRLAGLSATAYTGLHPFAYGVAPDVMAGEGALPRRLLRISQLIVEHDIVHFHFASSFLPDWARHVDARLIGAAGRRVLITFHGSEIRRPSVEAARNKYYVPFPGEDDGLGERRMRTWARLTRGHVVMLDPALLDHVAPFFDHVHLVGLMIDTARYRPRPPDHARSRPVVVHAPTERAGKGTDSVRAAVQALTRRGLEFEYVEVFGVRQAEAVPLYANADIIVDQLRLGTYGVLALEGMSLAKPVIGYVSESVRDRFPKDLPLILANPDTITEVLAHWIQHPRLRKERGLHGRAYVEREHDVRVVGKRLAAVYEALA